MNVLHFCIHRACRMSWRGKFHFFTQEHSWSSFLGCISCLGSVFQTFSTQDIDVMSIQSAAYVESFTGKASAWCSANLLWKLSDSLFFISIKFKVTVNMWQLKTTIIGKKLNMLKVSNFRGSALRFNHVLLNSVFVKCNNIAASLFVNKKKIKRL